MNSRIPLFQRILGVNFTFKRSCNQLPEGIVYPGFTFYPRTENFKDPPYEPSKLFFVKRIKSMKGRNPIERRTLEHLNIDGKKKENGHVSVVKNTANMNALLWKVKHLIEIKPIKINGELPKDSDFSGTFLRHTGEFIISPKLKINPEQISASSKHASRDTRLSRTYIREHLKKKWLEAFTPYE